MSTPIVPEGVEEGASDRSRWLEAFHAGSADVMTEVYTTHFVTVERAVGRVLTGADGETVIHEVFCRLLADAQLRAAFRGGSLRAWLATVAHHQAIDYRRRRERERPVGDAEDVSTAAAHRSETASAAASVEARLLIERFRDEWLPPKWRRVFEVRFLQQKPQVEAARALGMHRTTLVYQEFRIRQLLRKFYLKSEEEA
jgi:RNA polymerase sigma-70 factor (ECF subfamily)